ncbi:hypothetical protein [Symbioplanes lichenis]|uniref:hypothetical protein n=1 Tax=Symbioplanes lichenis TaxID=1629072 RepID=UPI002738258C|nr:hypothetical protein [Actinoplanes lichenis]
MRRLLMPAALAAALVIGAAGSGWAAPPSAPAVPSGGGWSAGDGRLVWRADERVPMGDAAVEFWSEGRLLGRPRPGADQRTFSLDTGTAPDASKLEVRAGGRRIDVPAPQTRRRTTVPSLAPQPAHTVDPGVKGKYRTVTGEYDLPGVKLPDFPAKVEMRAVVVAPKGAPGKRPLALFLHGRHSVCYGEPTEEEPDAAWPCPAGMLPIPSHRGYLQAQELLASQGYVTVSISANGINGQDFAAEDGGAQARSSLVRLHLAKWADWSGSQRNSAPAIVRTAPRADLGKVFLMGHSRGGEGVSRAAMDTLTPPPAAQDGYHGKVRWTIRGMLLIGPTIFGHNTVPDVPSATILPGCDGDVSDLQGQLFIDETRGVSRGKALHSSLYVVGANHNYFNTEWTPGQAVAPANDDWFAEDDPVCAPGAPTRLSAAQEQTVGATYIAAAARLFVAGDDRVRPLLDGSGVRAPSAGPARVLSHALGGVRTPAVVPDASVRATGGARICEQVTNDPAKSCLDPESYLYRSIHFTTLYGAVPEPGRYAAALAWSKQGQTMTLAPRQPTSLAGSQDLALRLIVPPNSTGTRLGVTVVDKSGRRTVLGDVTVNGLPASENIAAHWAQEVRVPLKGLRGSLAKLELTSRTASGQAWLIDAWGRRGGTPDPRETGLPRIDVGGLAVDEGNSGTRTYQIPVRVTGSGGGQLRFVLLDTVTWEPKSWVATVRPGTRTLRVPVEVTGDTLWGEGEGYILAAKAERGLVVGDWIGNVEIRNDDPKPALTLAPVADRVTEGGTLTWRVTLSAPAESYVATWATPQAPASGTELSSTDVDPQWFRDQTGEEPEPARPLSETWVQPYAWLEPGETSTDITVPTVADGVTEGPEVVELHFDEESGLAPVTGTVTD